ncbi:MAG: hypothetical protein NW241_09525 [Bacteroidia bacterium]|nr:hypothetical protein [Bacteroidia bacterium]
MESQKQRIETELQIGTGIQTRLVHIGGLALSLSFMAMGLLTLSRQPAPPAAPAVLPDTAAAPAPDTLQQPGAQAPDWQQLRLRRHDDAIRLSWPAAAAAGQPCTVERSFDGRRFRQIGEMRAASADPAARLQFTDRDPAAVQLPLAWYRVRSGGQLSPALKARARSGLGLYHLVRTRPDSLQILCAADAPGGARLRLVHSSGAIAADEQLRLGPVPVARTFGAASLPAGQWQVELSSPAGISTEFFTIR